MNLDYGNILSRAWQITWKHKVLWIFGILAGLARGASGSGSGSDGGSSGGSGSSGWPEFDRFVSQTDQNFWIALAIGLICLAFLFAIVIIVLRTIGQGGLIGGIRLADTTGQVTFGDAWSLGLSKFWTIFLIELVVGLVSFAAALLVILPGALLTVITFGLGLVCLIPVVCLLAIAGVILSIIGYFAQIAAVVENLGVVEALQRAWTVIRANLSSILILGLIVVFIGFIAGLLIGLPALAIIFPAVLAGVGFAAESQATAWTGVGLALMCCAVYAPIALVLGGILQTWTTAAWTLAYQQFTRPTAPGSAPAPEFTA